MKPAAGKRFLGGGPGFFRYPFMTMLPRMKISPIVARSAGIGARLAGSATVRPASTG
jgi:hypothetical protein